jgi:UDP-N-acetylmuramoyl-L-alanyl-D-glutamate--2,6-diaminopimelate ligase
MTLRELVQDLGVEAPEIEVGGVTMDSRAVRPGDLFAGVRGETLDGSRFAAQAVASGAVAVVAEAEDPGLGVPWIRVGHSREALALIARRYYGAPDEEIAVIGVTGTNGKTTTVYLIDWMLRGMNAVTGALGTIEYRVGDEVGEALNTTPESLVIYQTLERLRALGGSHLSMEVSSHALAQGRVHGLRFRTGVFTNLTQDHLDYHGTMEAYFAAKAKLFSGPLEAAVLNGDDAWSKRIVVRAGTRVLTYGLGAGNEVGAVDVREDFEGLRFRVEYPGGRCEVRSPLAGRVNVYNLLAAFSAGLTMGLDPERLWARLSEFENVPGRLERIDESQPFRVLVDYAHTDDALTKVLRSAREMGARRVIALFGCGGDRDRTKRPKMGRAASEGADFVVLTSDNPRSEDPLKILTDAKEGLVGGTAYVVEPDRARAIGLAMDEAGSGDVVVIAGKGHETYQEIAGVRHRFDDREQARQALRERGWRKA